MEKVSVIPTCVPLATFTFRIQRAALLVQPIVCVVRWQAQEAATQISVQQTTSL